ncbi:MAG: hypothetical protein ABI880_06690, partial [Acidobacteriota bacterium]
MMHATRRGFVETLATAAGMSGLLHATPLVAAPGPAARAVRLSGDGIGITPREYAALLDQLCREHEVG